MHLRVAVPQVLSQFRVFQIGTIERVLLALRKVAEEEIAVMRVWRERMQQGLGMERSQKNQMRRLLEYRAAYRPERFIQQSTEHLMILDLLSRGEILEASFAMKKHLSGALTEKTELIRALDEKSEGTI